MSIPPPPSEKILDSLAPKDRRWAVPILRAVEELGGQPKAREVRSRIRELYGSQLSEADWEWVVATQRISWTRLTLVHLGLLSGEARGIWGMTDKGRQALAECADEGVDLSDERRADDAASAGAAEEEAEAAAVETVVATTYGGWELPTLAALAAGASTTSELEEYIEKHYGHAFTPGDQRKNRQGATVWRYYCAWARNSLKTAGQAMNPTRGSWVITEAGRQRLAAETSTFSLERFRTLRATVRANGPGPIEPPIVPTWPGNLSQSLAPDTLSALAMALRPDLGPTPEKSIARNVVFAGPPGTGKTWLAERVAEVLTQEKPSGDGNVRLVQFHPSYGYEDFVWGIRPRLQDDKARFEEHKGPFLRLCQEAIQQQDELFVLIIDEINRGDPARIFGELLYALEYRGRPVTMANGAELIVPANVVVLGTMNTVDRSVALVDFALRRRFAFVRVDPQPELVAERHPTPVGRAAAQALRAVNERITEVADEDHQIGHSYFLSAGRKLATWDDLNAIWRVDIAPQLSELFHGRVDVVRDLTATWKAAIAEAKGADAEDE